MRIKLLYIFLLITNINFAQINEYLIKFGVQGNLLIPDTEFKNDAYVLSLFGRGFIKYELSSSWESEIGFGIGNLSGVNYQNKKWETNLIPLDFRFNFSPFQSQIYSPYIFCGIGLLRWNVTNLPSGEITKKSGWDILIPIGAGIEFCINSKLLIDLKGSYNFTSTDYLNNYDSKKNKDGFYSFSFGFTFVEGGNLSDSDGDGIIMKMEEEIGTNPNKFDTDDDGLSDGEEINLYFTNPLVPDSDKDNLTDFEEVKYFFSDPNSQDSDGDDILDFDEIDKFKTNPNQKDSDKDELSDGYEVFKYSTNPTLIDSDSDELNDKEEIFSTKTNPIKFDTDEDGVSDGIEFNILKTNPLVKENHEKYISENKTENKINLENLNTDKSVILQGVQFLLGSAEINSSSENILQQVKLILNENPNLKIEIHGYTDNIGNPDFNQKLSENRAETVKNWFVKNGINFQRIATKGFGSLNPIGNNEIQGGREKNRRIEIIKVK
ncbi:MAG: OmpA family protein [Ignavibacteriae bacterium]|nr:OmpA family protein [Ignavibacteriota bacterium]